jgi:hypothetical protein
MDGHAKFTIEEAAGHRNRPVTVVARRLTTIQKEDVIFVI